MGGGDRALGDVDHVKVVIEKFVQATIRSVAAVEDQGAALSTPLHIDESEYVGLDSRAPEGAPGRACLS
jgi:hypothetical protein